MFQKPAHTPHVTRPESGLCWDLRSNSSNILTEQDHYSTKAGLPEHIVKCGTGSKRTLKTGVEP